MKIVNTDGRKSSNILTNLTSFNKIFIKNVSYDNIKSKRKQGLTIYLEDTFLVKPQGREGVKMPSPPLPTQPGFYSHEFLRCKYFLIEFIY